MAKISIGEQEAVEVDLWGAEYRAIRLTKSVQKLVDREAAKIDKAGTTEAMMKAVGGLLDVRLEAVNGAPLPSKVIADKWAADDLSQGQLLKLLDDIASAEVPT